MEDESDEDTKFSLYFPLSINEDPTDYLKEDQRKSLVIGEAIDILLIAKYIGEQKEEEQIARWKEGIKSLYTLASVPTSETVSAASKGLDILESQEDSNKICIPFSSYKEDIKKKVFSDPLQVVMGDDENEKRRWFPVDDVTLICVQSVSVDYMATGCTKCNVHVAVWSPQISSPEINESGILDAFLKFTPDQVLQHYAKAVKQIVSSSLEVVSPPTVTCRHASAAGKHFICITVSNKFGNSLTVSQIKVSPNANESFLPYRIDDSASTDHEESEELDGSSILKIDRPSTKLPVTLTSLEGHTFMFTLSVKDASAISELLQEISLMCVVTWCKGNMQQNIVTNYRLPSIRIRKPGFVITSVPDSEIIVKKSFNMKYSITNNLQDFTALRLIWNPEKALSEPKAKENESYCRSVENVLQNVICHEPVVHLGACKAGSTLSATVSFQLLKPGLYELGQHMKLNLQYSVSNFAPGHQRKGSITSTHSMPMETKRDITMTTRSASACPLGPEESSTRRGSVTSLRSYTSMGTPEDSPIHTSKSGSYGNLLSSNHTSGHRSHRSGPSGSRPGSTMSSPIRPAPAVVGAVTPQQVLKRNCQVYVF